MSRQNGQVKMGAPIKCRAVRMYGDEDLGHESPRRIGRIYNLGDIQGIQITQPQAVGLIGGGGLLLGGVFVKGPAGTIMAILGALGIGAVGLNLIYNVLQTLPAMQPAIVPGGGGGVAPGMSVPTGAVQAAMPVQYVQAQPLPPPPPPKPTRSQSYATIATSAAPIAAELIKGLVSLF